MKIKIKKNAYVFIGTYRFTSEPSNFREWLKKNEGKWVTVDTKFLFTDQYNTTKGFRIYDSMVAEVKDDERLYMGRCKYCGRMLDSRIEHECKKYTKKNPSVFLGDHNNRTCAEYGVLWFKPENTFFLRYPKGLQVTKVLPMSYEANAVRFGTYKLLSYQELGYYRLYNGRKTINFLFADDTFFVTHGIGYTATKTLPIPVKDLLKLKTFMNK